MFDQLDTPLETLERLPDLESLRNAVADAQAAWEAVPESSWCPAVLSPLSEARRLAESALDDAEKIWIAAGPALVERIRKAEARADSLQSALDDIVDLVGEDPFTAILALQAENERLASLCESKEPQDAV